MTDHHAEQVEMVPAADHMRLWLKADAAARFLENRRADGIDFPYDSRPLRRLREAVAEGPPVTATPTDDGPPQDFDDG